MPLSRTEKTHSLSPFFAAETCTRGASALRYLPAKNKNEINQLLDSESA